MSAWTLLRESVLSQPKKRPLPLSQLSQRKLSSDERRQVRNEVLTDGFDEGEIHKFMEDPKTQGIAIDLAGGGKLVLFTQDTIADVANVAEVVNEVDALLLWLGTPVGFTVYLWWRDDPRILEADEWPTRRNVNGGWAMPGSNSIYIYRKEEYDRVLLHETIHAMNGIGTCPKRRCRVGA